MSAVDGLVTDPAGVARCHWCGTDPLYVDYHDREWGRPVHDNDRLFEKICLEGFQSGLAWITVLRKRDNFRAAFRGFGIEAVAAMGERDVTRLLGDAGIIRHRGKIEATINNARCAAEMLEAGTDLAGHIWSFAPRAELGREGAEWPVTTSPSAVALSKDLKGRGWRFVGPTTIYSFMQSMGLVNDHYAGCHVIDECETARVETLSREG